MIPDTANPLEIARFVVAALGVYTNIVGWMAAKRRLRTFSGADRSGRRRWMGGANVRSEVMIGAAHALLLSTAWHAAVTPEPAVLTQLALHSNLAQILIGVLLLGLSVLMQHDRAAAEMLDRVETEGRERGKEEQ
jgi:hypothetical protein